MKPCTGPPIFSTLHRIYIALVLIASACVHDTGEREQPFSLTPLTMDPAAEANEVERSLRRAGFVMRARVEGRGMVAIAAERPSTATAVRVITRLGTVLGVDAPDRSAPFRRRVSLLEELSGRDLDGDGTIELLIELIDEAMGHCIAIVRVLEDGRALELPLAVSEFGPNACAEDARDVLGDARAELLVRYTAPAVGLHRVPTVHVPFVGTGGLWGEADRSLAHPYYQRQRDERAAMLAVAERTGDETSVAQLRAEIVLLDALLAREAPSP